jgi:hypothetical protein
LAAYLEVANPKLAARLEQGKTYESSCLKNSRQVISARDTASSAFFRANLVLMLLMLASIFSYIFLSNFLVSREYILGLRKQQLSQLSAELLNENARRNRIDDLLSFVQASGMVEGRDINAVLEENGVALSGNRY